MQIQVNDLKIEGTDKETILTTEIRIQFNKAEEILLQDYLQDSLNRFGLAEHCLPIMDYEGYKTIPYYQSTVSMTNPLFLKIRSELEGKLKNWQQDITDTFNAQKEYLDLLDRIMGIELRLQALISTIEKKTKWLNDKGIKEILK